MIKLYKKSLMSDAFSKNMEGQVQCSTCRRSFYPSQLYTLKGGRHKKPVMLCKDCYEEEIAKK